MLVDATDVPLATADLNWLMKLSCTWDDGVHWLDACNTALDMHIVGSSGELLTFVTPQIDACTGSLHTRTQLLLAAKLLRTECGVNGLGRLHTRPITDANGCLGVARHAKQ